ncbi:hypothetical protein D9I70_09035 [Escherichia coli]|nr:hypothetical protein [Salmonella enterica]EEW2611821.1 hypothetical protein [Escherichia coli]EFD5148709.1 hypothetical protein [Escherichia coli]RCQ47135.1 hypothetical protein BEA13_11110 [Escherichia coli]HAH2537853.1 hypothetical protein [Escherichia coli]
MTLFIYCLSDDYFDKDTTCPEQQKIQPVISASPLPIVHPRCLLAQDILLPVTDTTCQPHLLQ